MSLPTNSLMNPRMSLITDSPLTTDADGFSNSPDVKLLYQTALASSAEHVAMYQAKAHPLLLELKRKVATLHLQQSFKPDIDELHHIGLNTAPLQSSYDLILLIPSKDKIQTLGWMADAFLHLNEQGKLLVACENQYGAKSYENALKKLAGHAYGFSKAKCRCFSAKRSQTFDSQLQREWLAKAKPQVVDSHGLWAQPGLFSWKSADVGSLLLLEHLPKLQGKGMDLCAGYGLLSAEILNTANQITHLHVVEADADGLICAQKNLACFSLPIDYHHLDAIEEKLPKHLDWVVCNPPFHRGQARDVSIGQRIVERACDSLVVGGVVYIVANRQLPYENILKAKLAAVEVIAADLGFKIIRGIK